MYKIEDYEICPERGIRLIDKWLLDGLRLGGEIPEVTIVPSGSFFINGIGQDIDYFVELEYTIKLHVRMVKKYLVSRGFIPDIDILYKDTGFISYRHKDTGVNIIFLLEGGIETVDLATKVCNVLDNPDKETRITVFDTIREFKGDIL